MNIDCRSHRSIKKQEVVGKHRQIANLLLILSKLSFIKFLCYILLYGTKFYMELNFTVLWLLVEL